MAQVIIISGPQVSGWTKSLGSTTKIYLSLSSAEESVNTLIGRRKTCANASSVRESPHDLSFSMWFKYNDHLPRKRSSSFSATRTIPRKTIWSWSKSYWKDLFISTVPNVPWQLQPVSRTSQKFPGNNLRTSRKTVRNPPEPCRELHRNRSETLQNLPGNCTGTCPKPTGTTYCGRINSWFKSSWKELFKPSRTTLRAARKTHRNLAGNCTGTCLKPTGTFLGTVQEPTVGELTLDLSPPERNFSNRPEPPFELPAKPTGTLPGTAKEPVWNLPEPSWELHKNLPET